MAITLGIDTSSHQDPTPTRDPSDDIDWAAVGRTVYDFALCRMSIGRSTRDDTGRRDLRGMVAKRIPVCGGYGVVGYTEPVADGAKLLLDEVATVIEPRRVLIMLDGEPFAGGAHPSLRQINRYAIQVHNQLGRWPVAYLPGWFLDQLHQQGDGDGTVRGLELANCPWAPSRYFGQPWTTARLQQFKPTNLRGFKRLAWLQYASSGTVAGIQTRVDLNCYYGTLTQLRAQLLGQPEGIFMALTDAEQGEVLKAARQINSTVAAGQTSFQGTVEAILGTTQRLVNLVGAAQSTLGDNIDSTRSAVLGAIAALPGPAAGVDVQAVAERIAAGLRDAGVTIDPAAIAAALRQQLTTAAPQ